MGSPLIKSGAEIGSQTPPPTFSASPRARFFCSLYTPPKPALLKEFTEAIERLHKLHMPPALCPKITFQGPVSFSVFSVFRDKGDLVLLRAFLQDYSQRMTQITVFGSRVLEKQVHNNLPMLIVKQNRVLLFSLQGQVSVVTK